MGSRVPSVSGSVGLGFGVGDRRCGYFIANHQACFRGWGGTLLNREGVDRSATTLFGNGMRTYASSAVPVPNEAAATKVAEDKTTTENENEKTNDSNSNSNKNESDEEPSTAAVLKHLAPHVWPVPPPDADEAEKQEARATRARVMAACGFTVASKCLNVQMPVLMKHAIDALAVSGDAAATSAITWVGLFALARLGASACNEARSTVFGAVTARASRSLYRTVFSHLHALDHSFHVAQPTGAITRTVDRGVRGASFLLGSASVNVIPTTFELALVCAVLQSRLGFEYAALALGSVGAYSALTFGVTSWRTKFRREMNRFDQEASALVSDSLSMHELVKLRNSADMETMRYDKALAKHEQYVRKSQWSLGLLNFGQSAVFSLALGASLALCASRVASGDATVGDVAMVQGFLLQLSLPLNFLGSIYRETRQSFVDMSQMFSLLDRKPAVRDCDDRDTSGEMAVTQMMHKPPEIVFDDVHFAYSSQPFVNASSIPSPSAVNHPTVGDWHNGTATLNGASIRIPAGTSCALVGGSGSGKSTLARLLVRLYDPWCGSVMVNGVDVRHLPLADLRRYVAMVPQDCALFHDTVFANVAYGLPAGDATRERIEEACRRAQVHDSIMHLPDGYNTVVGGRGLKLSGGERQRIALARAFAQRAKVLLLDEATAHLDAVTERRIFTAEERESATAPTTLVIAHRLDAAARCDQVAVLRDGIVVETGTHADLVNREGGEYRRLWDAWRSEKDAVVKSSGSE